MCVHFDATYINTCAYRTVLNYCRKSDNYFDCAHLKRTVRDSISLRTSLKNMNLSYMLCKLLSPASDTWFPLGLWVLTRAHTTIRPKGRRNKPKAVAERRPRGRPPGARNKQPKQPAAEKRRGVDVPLALQGSR